MQVETTQAADHQLVVYIRDHLLVRLFPVLNRDGSEGLDDRLGDKGRCDVCLPSKVSAVSMVRRSADSRKQ